MCIGSSFLSYVGTKRPASGLGSQCSGPRHFPCLDMWLQHKPERSAVMITGGLALQTLARLKYEPLPAPPVPPRTDDAEGHLMSHRLQTPWTHSTGHGCGLNSLRGASSRH
ncbi:unnamed protein product [Ixodes pacificus]